MLFQIVNPFDPYTMLAEDHETAAVAIAVVGEGKMGGKEIGGNAEVPIFLFVDIDDWFSEKFGKTFGGALEHATAKENMPKLIAALGSVLVGDEGGRAEYVKAIAGIDGARARMEFRQKWHDERRTSTSDVGRHCWAMAQHLRRQLANGRVD